MCAIDSGAVLCWDRNDLGATGGNTSENPIQVPTPVVNVGNTAIQDGENLRAGYAGFGLRKADGSQWLWGTPAGVGYAANYNVSDVAQLGWAQDPRYLLKDGTYHSGKTVVKVNCGEPPQ